MVDQLRGGEANRVVRGSPGIGLSIQGPHASVEDIDRGLAAAERVLKQSGFSALDAKCGADARDAWGESGLAPLHTPSATEVCAAEAWDEAAEAALRACYRGRNIPIEACLVLGGATFDTDDQG